MCYSSTLRTDTVCNTDIQHDHDSVKAIDLTKKTNKKSTYSSIYSLQSNTLHCYILVTSILNLTENHYSLSNHLFLHHITEMSDDLLIYLDIWFHRLYFVMQILNFVTAFSEYHDKYHCSSDQDVYALSVHCTNNT